MVKPLFKITTYILSILTLISFWLFSRFTVDDAFITWRYGKNLVDFGIWNYNPSIFDMTQGYTNPIFAALSIIPAFFGIDVVLFFKLMALLVLAVFLIWFLRQANNKYSLIMVLIFSAFPALFIHAFSGLETFLFTSLMAVLLIQLIQNKFWSSIGITLILFFTRPESWLLAILLPLYFLTDVIENNTEESNFKSISKYFTDPKKLNWQAFAYAFLILSIPLGLYFLFHKIHFNNILPNTFYIKSGKILSFRSLLHFSWLALPLIILIPLRKIRLFILSGSMFGAMIVSYSTTDFHMNYSERFAFHIFAPIYFFIVYIAFHQRQNFYDIFVNSLGKNIKISFQILIITALLPFFASFANHAVNLERLTFISTLYPRSIDSYAALGKTLKTITDKYKLKSFTFGDAGIVAYHSKLIALDTIGLASSAVAQNGVTFQLLNSYNPDIIVLHSNIDGIFLTIFNQQIVYDWAVSNKMHIVCDIYLVPHILFRLYAKKSFPELIQVCNDSKQKNNINDAQYFWSNIKTPPWVYWKE